MNSGGGEWSKAKEKRLRGQLARDVASGLITAEEAHRVRAGPAGDQCPGCDWCRQSGGEGQDVPERDIEG